MGGDGGVVATNRRFMRGAGTADTTGDHNQGTSLSSAEIKVNQEREALEILTTCALSKVPLQATDTIVACRYGRLYLKEAVVQALLLRRKTGAGTSTQTTLDDEQEQALAHIKKLSDLYAVRGNVVEGSSKSLVWMCPITGKSLTGRVPAAILLVPGNPDNPNLVSEFAPKQLSSKDMETEYGPIERKIRLAPTPEQLVEVRAELEEERSKKKSNKKKGSASNKSDEKATMVNTTGKRKRPDEDTTGKASTSLCLPQSSSICS